MDLNNFKTFKIAKTAIKDLEDSLHIIDISLNGLKMYKKYRPVKALIMDLHAHKQIIESYLQKCKNVVESK